MEVKPCYFKLFACLIIAVLFLTSAEISFAANGIISILPSSGNYTIDQKFSLVVRIDGAGTPFNAAKAQILIPPMLTVQDLYTGDCGFAFVKTPTKSDPSFAGVILGGSSKACTVYTLTLKARNTGEANITLSDTSIKSYRGASELLSSTRGANYSIRTSSSDISSIASLEPTPTLFPLLTGDGTKLYDISYAISLPNNISLNAVNVTLDPELPTLITVSPVPDPDTSNTAVATFQNVPEGVHTITTFYKTKPLLTQVVNVAGNNRSPAFGASAKPAKPTWIWYWISIGAFVILTILAVFMYKRYRSLTSNSSNSAQ